MFRKSEPVDNKQEFDVYSFLRQQINIELNTTRSDWVAQGWRLLHKQWLIAQRLLFGKGISERGLIFFIFCVNNSIKNIQN